MWWQHTCRWRTICHRWELTDHVRNDVVNTAADAHGMCDPYGRTALKTSDVGDIRHAFVYCCRPRAMNRTRCQLRTAESRFAASVRAVRRHRGLFDSRALLWDGDAEAGGMVRIESLYGAVRVAEVTRRVKLSCSIMHRGFSRTL